MQKNYIPNVQESNIIIALDFDNEKDVLNLVNKINPKLCKLKVGKELFTAYGPKIIETLMKKGFDIFLDLKFHDIPNTVYNAIKVVSNMNIWMVNVHAQGGQKMLEFAKNAISQTNSSTLLIAVTLLTSLEQKDLIIYDKDIKIITLIEKLAKLSYDIGLDGVVCSAQEASLIKSNTVNSFLTICPGIRTKTATIDDQTRIMTPSLAIKNKADYLVIGRPITKSNNPYNTLLTILDEVNKTRINLL
jgi:orotidine-5'-phosphate decarboxylase